MSVVKPHIEGLFGPMGGGKTTELMRRGTRYSIAGYKVQYVKPLIDERSKVGIETHDGRFIPSIAVNRLSDVDPDGFDVFCVDEGQFFSDLDEGSERLVKAGKIVVVAALSGDATRSPFPSVIRFRAHCDRDDFFPAICLDCGDDAPFTARVGMKEGEIKVGGIGDYRPLCRRCYAAFCERRR